MDGFRRITRELEELGLTVLRNEGAEEGGEEAMFGMVAKGPVGWLAFKPNGAGGAEPTVPGAVIEIGCICASSPAMPAHPVTFGIYAPTRCPDGESAWGAVRDFAQGGKAAAPASQGLADPAVREYLVNRADSETSQITAGHFRVAVESLFPEKMANTLLAHVNKVLTYDGVLVVYLDNMVCVADLDAHRELLRLRLWELFGNEPDELRFLLSKKEKYRRVHPYKLQIEEKHQT